MRLGDTIIASATGHAWTERAIIRISGPTARATAASLCTGTFDPNSASRGAYHTTLATLPNAKGWPAEVLIFNSPASYTGEDVVELIVPGSPILTEAIINAALKQEGTRIASPGEFTARAYLNGKISATQAEGVRALIESSDATNHAAAQRLLSGETGSRFRATADEIASILALVEAGIDFTDQEDVVAITPQDLLNRTSNLLTQVQSWLGSQTGEPIDDGEPRITIIGKPNAGKSTLFNAILKQSRALVSNTPGTTRDAIEEPVIITAAGIVHADNAPENTAGRRCILTDLAGLDAALASSAGSAEQAGQAKARSATQSASVCIACDPQGRFEFLDTLATNAVIIRVQTKADLPQPSQANPTTTSICALDGWGLSVLQRLIADAVEEASPSRSSADAGMGAAIARHRSSLTRAAEALADAAAIAQTTIELNHHNLLDAELAASALRLALDAIGEVIGSVTPDDVIGRIYATFCVGK